jgi:hypothetical protein
MIKRPDKWVVIKISSESRSKPMYKVFACWYGGYAGSDSWRMNSGITKVTLEGNVYSFEGYSGSVYECHKDVYGMNMYGGGILMDFRENAVERGFTIDIMDEKTNWLEIDYGD